jgi:LuxR family maltose regulon positive regulatory protein
MQHIAAADKNRLVETWASYLETSVHYRWNDLERAVRHFNELAGQPYTMDTTVAVDVHCALSLAYQHLQRSDQADETVRRLLGLTRQASVPLYRTIASSIQARLSLLRGDTESAVHWLQTADLAADAGIMLWWLEVPRLTECRVLIAEGSDASLQEAVDKLERYDQENEAVHNTCQRITILPLLALATHNRGRTDEALAILGRAVVLAEPGGFIRPFADLGAEMAALLQELVARGFADASMRSATVRYLNQVFAAFPEPVAAHDAATSSPAPGTAAGLVEALTGREMEVLALLDRRLTNQEIARELVITVGTVKQHTNSIYGKLGVGDRRLAVARARSLGLLPQ